MAIPVNGALADALDAASYRVGSLADFIEALLGLRLPYTTRLRHVEDVLFCLGVEYSGQAPDVAVFLDRVDCEYVHGVTVDL